MTLNRQGVSSSSSDKPPALFWCDMRRLAIILILIMGLPCWAANDPTGDPNCVGWYTFEDGQSPDWLNDASTAGNDMTNATCSQDGTTYKEGTESLHASQYGYYVYVNDTDLSAGFPGKNSGGGNVISVVAWFRCTNLQGLDGVVNKYGTSGNRSFLFGVNNAGSGSNQYLIVSASDGASVETVQANTGCTVGNNKWYHVGYTFDGATKKWTAVIWDDNASTEYTDSGTFTDAVLPGVTQRLAIKAYQDGFWGGMLGNTDEVGIFDDVLTNEEITQIRSGTYGAAADTGTSNWWWRRRHND